jgi:hypothetical protein
VLVNDDDPDGDGLTAVLVADVEHGSLVLHADGSFAYQPAAGFAGLDAFRYAASDGAARAEAVVTISVAAAPLTPPLAPTPSPALTTSPSPRPRPTGSPAPTPRPPRSPTPAPTASATAAPTPTQTPTGTPAAPTVPASSPSRTPPASMAPAPSAPPSPTAGPVAPDPAMSQGADWMRWPVLGLLGLVGLTFVGIGTLIRRRP